MFDASPRVNLSPDKRNIGMVFQSYALWPHMTVRKNIAYPLRARKIKEGLQSGWVEETAGLVDCGQLLDRYPAQLSGGQQQRVALARGLVARPELVLFDEPLSNLDARLRDQVRAEIHELHTRLGFTAVFVTHDQSEALALGDRLAVMRHGRIEQYDTPERIFERPATEYVAAFLGMGNRLVCQYVDGRWVADGQVLDGARCRRRRPERPWQFGCAATTWRCTRRTILLRWIRPRPASRSSTPSTPAGTWTSWCCSAAPASSPASRPATPGSWPRRMVPGDRLVASFRPATPWCIPPKPTRPRTPKRSAS